MKAESVSDLLSAARKHLRDSPTAALDARLLLQAATNLSPTELVGEPMRLLEPAQIQSFNAMIKRRLAHEPVSRILGRREFYGREFQVTPAVLDPRADTECVVEKALNLVPRGRFIDLGTGSGAIAVTLCSENQDLSGVATDLSRAALDVARRNAALLGVANRLHFHQGSWFSGLSESFDLIISNPPYIRQGAELDPDVVEYDPHLALFGGVDGLDAYRAIASGASRHLAANGHVVVELGHDQAVEVESIFAKHGFVVVDKALDIAGLIRCLTFTILS